MQLRYRADIDGLRAFSIIAILIYHFFPNLLPGGFVGVDIFFVISGYLITTILVEESRSDNFSVRTFYLRRIRRILPALTLVLFSCLVLGSILLLAKELTTLGKHVFFAGFFSSNFLLMQSFSYFADKPFETPLLHLWSLAVEEQFYLAWPFIIWFALKFKKIATWRLLTYLILASFIFNVIYVWIEHEFTFYSPFTRLWELAAGGVLATFNFKDALSRNILTGKILSALSLLGLFGSVFFIREGNYFPGYWAALPIISSMLFIVAGPDAFANQFFSRGILVFIGLISYPLYLWHWPLISITHIISFQEPSAAVKVSLIALSFILSTLTFFYIEKPLRSKGLSFKALTTVTVLFALTALMGLTIWQANGFPQRYPEIEKLAVSRNTFRPTGKESKKCSGLFTSAEICAALDLDKPAEIAVIGDSHAPTTYYGIKNHYQSKNQNLAVVAKYATAPLKGITVRRSSDLHNLDSIIDYVTKNKNIHTVILSALWPEYFDKSDTRPLRSDHKHRLIDPSNLEETNQNLLFEKGLRNTFNTLLANGKKIIFIYNVPVLNFSVTRCFARPLISQPEPCLISEEQALNNYRDYRKVVEKLLLEPQFREIKTFDPVVNFCQNGSCKVVRDDQLLYHDTNHLTMHGSEVLYRGFGD